MWDGIERRKFPRVEYPCLITVRSVTAPPQAILTHTENISVGGVRVIIAKKIEPMTEVDLEIDLMDTLPNIFARGTISWVKKFLPVHQGRPQGPGRNVEAVKGAVTWVKEIPSTQKGAPMRYDTGIQFLGLKNKDRGRVENIVNRLLGRSR
jgi:hypothetical protein